MLCSTVKERGHIEGPSFIALPKYATLHLSCDGKQDSPLLWFFKSRALDLNSKFISRNPILELDKLRGSNSGSYICYGDRGGKVFFLDSVDVIVYGKMFHSSL